ncbi:hypothetical protein [Cupriavidus gilardii]|uniref:hypothetical protein n=1 Tax=Cupriavidus gilardii TaxID=82541 RepID=UPI0021B1B75C|nr:hypothetical protein [Cupriavidus gilardii]UXC38240.1 hypothetical protein N4G38_24580 [Cupriavidus gilardii]
MGELDLDELERLVRMQESSPVVTMKPAAVLALIARIRDLEAQSGDRLVELAEQAARIRQLEQDAARYQHVRAHGMPKLCPAGFYYHDGVFYPTADAAIDAYMAAIDAARKEKGHG